MDIKLEVTEAPCSWIRDVSCFMGCFSLTSRVVVCDESETSGTAISNPHLVSSVVNLDSMRRDALS